MAHKVQGGNSDQFEESNSDMYAKKKIHFDLFSLQCQSDSNWLPLTMTGGSACGLCHQEQLGQIFDCPCHAINFISPINVSM